MNSLLGVGIHTIFAIAGLEKASHKVEQTQDCCPQSLNQSDEVCVSEFDGFSYARFPGGTYRIDYRDGTIAIGDLDGICLVVKPDGSFTARTSHGIAFYKSC